MSEPALCQCMGCLKYLALNRDPQATSIRDRNCEECVERLVPGMGGGLPLAILRATLTDPLSVELLGLLTEECGEVSQRIGKILRWGWEADFEGTTQQHKFEVELGDVVAAIMLAIHNGLVRREQLHTAAINKLRKLWEDAQGPRQRLQVATVPDKGFVHFGIAHPGETAKPARMEALLYILDELWDK